MQGYFKQQTHIKSSWDLQRNQCAFFFTLCPIAMASLGHAPAGRVGGWGILHTHCPAASSSGASDSIRVSSTSSWSSLNQAIRLSENSATTFSVQLRPNIRSEKCSNHYLRTNPVKTIWFILAALLLNILARIIWLITSNNKEISFTGKQKVLNGRYNPKRIWGRHREDWKEDIRREIKMGGSREKTRERK